MAKAIALLSGGLDSTLAVLLLRRQDVEVTAVTFLMHFGCDMSDSASCTTDASSLAARYGFEVKMCHLAEKFTEIVKNPRFGHGKNMNPCMDCRILMLREAKELMEMAGADFVATGEVMGQRPMSQRQDTFPRIDREAGLEGLVLRPLSAKLMKPTRPELEGLVDREQLMGLSGRSRKPQIALAEEFGLTDYPAPAGGCLLTDPNFSYRLRDLLAHEPDPSLKELHLLKVGRHFRRPGGVKVVVGRNDRENTRIRELSGSADLLMHAVGVGSPLTIVPVTAAEAEVEFAAAACARYSDAKREPEVEVRVLEGGPVGRELQVLRVAPATDMELDRVRVNMPEKAVRTR
jgi:tRNA U34 2-thiouridine synthase MnmA/TrmU